MKNSVYLFILFLFSIGGKSHIEDVKPQNKEKISYKSSYTPVHIKVDKDLVRKLEITSDSIESNTLTLKKLKESYENK